MLAKGRLHKVLCSNIRRARDCAGMTQQQVADRLGMKQPSYAAIESGRREPGLGTIERLASVFGAKPFELLNPDFSVELVA